MNLKNYTSEVPASSSMGKIEKLLVEIGANHINKEYRDKVCVGLTFLITYNSQTVPFKLEARVDACFKVLWKEISRPKEGTRERCMMQAEKTAWKILCDWVEVQCSMIMLEQAEILQMFLPFVYDMRSNQTYFEKLKAGGYKALLPNSQP